MDILPPTNKQELLKRANNLAGITLGQLAHQLDVTLPTEMQKAKGWSGKLLELALGANAANTPQPDFIQLDIELKTIPINHIGKPQESTYICMVQLDQQQLRHWHTSLVKHKLSKILWIPIEATKTTPLALRRIGNPLLWQPNAAQATQLQQDWQELADMIVLGELDKISAQMGKYLQIRPKASNARCLTQDKNQIGVATLPRGFYLRASFTDLILNNQSSSMHNHHFDRKISIAPMMDHTDKHFRYFMRLLSTQMVLYTEMITTAALLHGNRNRLLSFNEIEHPLAIQLGGNSPQDLALCAKLAEAFGYDEVNLNIGCPSDRVQTGQFGACMMFNAALVADCVNAMLSVINIPVTVKTRIGVDVMDSYDFLKDFIQTVSEAGCKTFIIHARKAILKGLSPKQNRQIPPLNYERIHRIKQDFPTLKIILNGGINKLKDIQQQLQYVDGIMIGRMAYHDPYALSQIDPMVFEIPQKNLSRQTILAQYKDYADSQIKQGVHPRGLVRHLIGLYHGQPNAKTYRRLVSNTKLAANQQFNYWQQLLSFVAANDLT